MRIRRLARFAYVGPHRYSLTLCALERRALFVNAGIVTLLRSQILNAATTCGFELIAYCFMPDHVHLLTHGVRPDASLPTFVKRAKQLSGFHGRRVCGQPIWQAGYYERVLRETEDTRTVVAYILGNPVRAGLVSDAGAYPFSGSGVCTLHELIESARGPVRPT